MILTEQQKRILTTAGIPRQVVDYLASKPSAFPTAKYLRRVAIALGYRTADEMIIAHEAAKDGAA